MANSLIHYAYVSGEISPTLFGRSDLEKYDLGLAKAQNYFVDYRGGLSTRPGSIFRDWLQNPTTKRRWFSFEFSPNVENTNLVLFGEGYIRFAQGGNYVLNPAQAVAGISNAVVGVVTVPGHGYLAGQMVRFVTLTGMVELASRTFEVSPIDADNFYLLDQFGNFVSTSLYTAFTAGTIASVYTLASPYASEDLAELNIEQFKDLLRLTHYNYAPRDLTRLDSANWSLTQTNFFNSVTRPNNISATPSSTASAGVAFGVTAVDHDGQESILSDIAIIDNTVDYSTTAGNMIVGWDTQPNVAHYNVYRSTISSEGAKTSRTQQLGFLGRAYGAQFLDTNIIPDFTKAPPRQDNPFANGAINWINVTNGGSGYTQDSVIVITDASGTGAIAYPVVSVGGSINGVVVISKGQNYVAPSISADIGTGATFAAELSPLTGNWPTVSAIFQQRQVYAGTLNFPLGIWGSRPGKFNNFDVSSILVDNDAYTFELDAAKVAIIRHLLPMRGGLLAFNQLGIWLISGGTTAVVTPTNALAEPQSYTGVSSLSPIKIETDILYVEAKGYTVRLLSYNDLSKLYAGSDISILAAHLFGQDKEILSWTFAQEPFKIVHAIRADGQRLLGTIIKDQNLFAWTPSSTQGYYKQAVTVREERQDKVYLDVERYINGKVVAYIEEEAPRDFGKIEDAWAVDSGLSIEPSFPNATLVIETASGSDVLVIATSPVFSINDVNGVIFIKEAKLRITSYISPTQVRVNILRPITDLFPETDNTRDYVAGEWEYYPPTTILTGMNHLEGQTVKVLADGNVINGLVVSGGYVTLPYTVNKITAGLGYRCVARTLPLTARGNVIEDKRMRVVGLGTRVHESRGLKTGRSLSKLYDMKERRNEVYGEPIAPLSDMTFLKIDPSWEPGGQTYYVVEDPLPVTILGHVNSVDIGDDPE